MTFGVPESSFVELNMYDVNQKKVKTIFDGDVEPGLYEVTNDTKIDDSTSLPSGIYFIRMTAYDKYASLDSNSLVVLFDDTSKMILLK